MNKVIEKTGFISQGILNYTPREAFQKIMNGSLLLDVRPENMNRFKIFDVPNLLFCPSSVVNELYKNLPTNIELICADTSGLKSLGAAKQLTKLGLNKVANMAGGLVDWERQGLAVSINIKERLSGSCVCQLKPRERKKYKNKYL